MGKFDIDESMPSGGATRGLTAEDMQEANAAIEDGKVRHAPATPEIEETVKAIKRYLSKEGWGCKVTMSGGKIHWRVVVKKEMSEDHKATLKAALEEARKARDAKKASQNGATAEQTTEQPTEQPTAPTGAPAAPQAPATASTGSGKRKAS